MKKETLWILWLGTICLVVVAVFSIANGNTAMGIAEFLGAAAGILAVRRFCVKEMKTERAMQMTMGCIFLLLCLLGVAGILNHIWNTGESLFQPVCITVIGAAAAGASFRKRGDHWNSEED